MYLERCYFFPENFHQDEPFHLNSPRNFQVFHTNSKRSPFFDFPPPLRSQATFPETRVGRLQILSNLVPRGRDPFGQRLGLAPSCRYFIPIVYRDIDSYSVPVLSCTEVLVLPVCLGLLDCLGLTIRPVHYRNHIWDSYRDCSTFRWTKQRGLRNKPSDSGDEMLRSDTIHEKLNACYAQTGWEFRGFAVRFISK